MSFSVWVELICLNCAKSRFGQHVYGIIPRRQIAKDAKKAGWVLGGVDNDAWFCCEKCKSDWDKSDYI